MEKLSSIIRNIYTYAVVICASAAMSVLCFISLISTCYMTSDELEMTFFCNDNTVANLLVITLFLAVLFFLRKIKVWEKVNAKIQDDKIYNKIKKILLLAILAIGSLWVFSTQYVPGSDQLDVVNCAHKLFIGETNMLEPGGYMDRYNNQLGLIVIDYFLARIWGDFNIMAFQLLNVLGLTLFYKKVVEILEIEDVSRIAQLGTLAMGIIFYPMILYTSFVYGTIWSVTLSLYAFYHVYRFLNDYKWWRIPVASIFMAVAIQVKNNVWILMIAILIYSLVHLFKDKKNILKILVLVFCLMLTALTVNKLPKAYIEKKTGYKLEQGITSWAFIAMGLQEGEKAPGWWNAYNYYSYDDNDYNSYGQSVEAKGEIKKSLQNFKADKPYAFRFFAQKITSIWSEPTYQSFWVNQIRNHRVTLPSWIDKSMTAPGYTKAANVLNFFQILLFLGVLLWLILEDKDIFLERSIFVLAFLGGFMFHLFWEAKSQYTVTFVAMLIPCAIMGYQLLLERLKGDTVKAVITNASVHITPLVVATVAVASFIIAYVTIGDHCLTLHNPTYQTYLDKWEKPYTNETVLDIANMKAEINGHEDFIVYLNHLLDINDIHY